MNRFRIIILAATMCLGLAAGRAAVVGAARTETEPGLPGVVSLAIFPDQITLAAGRVSQRVLVSGETTNHFFSDLSRQVTLVSDHPEIALVEAGGVVRGLSVGAAIVTARVGALTARAQVTVQPAPTNAPLSFVNDVLPVLSKAGCNAGACHAKSQGQNGFKLSVFAYDPQSDYAHIVKASRGRRVSPANPAGSLLLQKPTMELVHGGGRRLEAGTEFYQTLIEWIKQGLPYARGDEPALQEIKVFPAERRYLKGATQPLLVQARYADGSTREVTQLTEFSSNDAEIARVDEHGLVSVGTLSGEVVVLARFMGLVSVSRITVPADRVLPDALYAALPVHNEIDKLVYARLQKLGLSPSGPCTDAEFLRRASLDATGVLPTPEEVRAFGLDTNPDKRNELINRLLASPAYADYWAVKWGDLIRPNPFRVGVKPVYLLDLWLRESFRQNKPYDQFVREIVTAQGSTHKLGPVAVFRDRREPIDATTLISQIFLGVRLECAKCHHHPNEKWSQSDYYQFAAYFAQTKHKGQGISAPISGEAEYIYFAPGGEVRHPISGEVMKPKPPDGPVAALAVDRDPRVALADWMARPDNPFFARAAVNRVWANFMGRGLVDPVDDFRASNPPSNEALLDWLAQDFVRHSYDLKHLMRTIMRAHVYQISALPNEHNLADTRNFSRFYRRRLTAEVLLDAVSGVTGVAETFQGLPSGARAMETWNHRLDSDFMDAFGRPNASADCPCERDVKGSMVQALHLMNSNNLQAKIGGAEGRAKKLADSSRSEPEIITELYIAAYGRAPATDEMQRAQKAFAAKDATRKTATEDLLWALINSAEFVFNH